MIIHGELSVGHAKVLLSVPQASVQKDLAEKVKQKKLTVRMLEKLIKDSNSPDTASASEELPSVNRTLIQNLAEQVQKAMSTKVTIDYVDGKGKLNIHFYSDDELTAITDKLRGN
jgi:ParB family chromosome partitioning protein